jgi:hypothetical protein
VASLARRWGDLSRLVLPQRFLREVRRTSLPRTPVHKDDKGAGRTTYSGSPAPFPMPRRSRYSTRTLCLLRPAGRNGNVSDITVAVRSAVLNARRDVSDDSIRPRAAIDRVVASDVVRDVDEVIP